MPLPIAQWNPARGVWETSRTSLLCGHSEPFLETWPTSGTTRHGTAYLLQPWAPPMGGSGSSSSRRHPTDGTSGAPSLLELLMEMED
jgi:hypothetical protein